MWHLDEAHQPYSLKQVLSSRLSLLRNVGLEIQNPSPDGEKYNLLFRSRWFVVAY